MVLEVLSNLNDSLIICLTWNAGTSWTASSDIWWHSWGVLMQGVTLKSWI